LSGEVTSDLVKYLVTALLSSSVVGGAITLYRTRLDKDSIVATASDQAVVTMGRVLDAANSRAEQESHDRMRVQRDLEAALARIHELEVMVAELRTHDPDISR